VTGLTPPLDVHEDQQDFVDHVLEVVSAIPPGRVMTYGYIAERTPLRETADDYRVDLAKARYRL
jgi:O6-methylguanine-DNA--protein-cysteine methyltransferase